MHDSRDATRRTVLQTIGAGVAGGLALAGTAGARGGGLKRELAEVRSATARFNDPDNAQSAGYHPEDEPPICGMGHHFANMDLLDFTIEKRRPEVMVYGEDDGGNLILGAVEYVAPKFGPYATDPPDSPFDSADPEWDILELPSDAPVPFTELWTLHVWVHTNNPDGVFNPTNPRKQFSPEGCTHH